SSAALYPPENIRTIPRLCRTTFVVLKVIDKGIYLDEDGINKQGVQQYKECIEEYFKTEAIVGALTGIHDKNDEEDFLPFEITNLMNGIELEVHAVGPWGKTGWYTVEPKQETSQRYSAHTARKALMEETAAPLLPP